MSNSSAVFNTVDNQQRFTLRRNHKKLLCVVCRRLWFDTDHTVVMPMTRLPAAVLLLLMMMVMRQVQGQGKLTAVIIM